MKIGTDMNSYENELKGHIIKCIDSGWCFVHQKGSAEQVFREGRQQLDAFVLIEDAKARIASTEETLTQIIDAGWPHINTVFASENVKKIFSDARQYISEKKSRIGKWHASEFK